MTLLFFTACFKTAPVTTNVEAVSSPDAFPYELYDQVFDGRVTEDGYIDYAAISGDRTTLDTFLGHVAEVSPASNPELFPDDAHGLAFYLNAYNALAVRGVLDRPDIVSVFDIKVDFFYTTRYRIGGDKVSLYKLENGIIREQFGDPRIHFFLNCQSVSCPPFPATAVTPESLDSTLDAATKAFVNDPAHVELLADNAVAVSSIFQWYAEDFGGMDAIAGWIGAYRDDVPADAKVSFKEYDWGLIKQPGKGPT